MFPNGSSQNAILYPLSGAIFQILLRCLPPLSEIFLHNSSMLGSVIQIWKNPDFQYSKLSFVRLSAFGSIYSNISNPTWLPELNQTIRILFKLGPWISLRITPSGE